MSSGLTPLTVETVRFDADLYVVAVSGELSTSSAGLLGKRLTKLLTTTQRVLVDLSGLRLSFAPAAQIFPAVLAALGGWPEVRLVMFGARPELAAALDALRVTLQVPLAPDESDARLLVDRRPPVVSRILELERAPSAARRGRLFVEATCSAWQLDLVRDDAMAVASELVANAVVHAGTSCRLVLRCRERGLTIAVYDGRPDLVLPLRAVAEGGQGHGLFLVAALSLHWGARVGHDEKCVWAFLPATASVTYSHTVRKAAHDAVRVALAHGADSPDATALRQHVARLAEEHGLAFVRHVADELMAELAEATSAIIPEDS